jgi:hypothetical protein
LAINLNNLLLRNSTNENIILDQNLAKSLMASAEKQGAHGSTSSLRKISGSRNDSEEKPNMVYFKQLLKKLNIATNDFEISKIETQVSNTITDTENNNDNNSSNKNTEDKITEENLDVSHS